MLNNHAFVKALESSPDYRKIIGGEMEAWGLYQTIALAETKGAAFQWIVVKGICDWGFDKKKGWQPLAAAAAADLVHRVLVAPGALTF